MSEASSASSADNNPVFLVSWPKIILLYPTFFTSLVAGFVSAFAGQDSLAASWMGTVFLWVFGLNLVVLSFDFPRTTSLTLFFLIMAIGLALTLLFTFQPQLVPAIHDLLSKIQPHANATFYFCLSTILGVMYLFVLALVRFDYWEVRPNELLHHHGFLSNLERHSAPNLRITKEINDVFEYLLLGSGRLILHPSTEPRAHVLDNVLFINRREKELTDMLGALQVRVRTDAPPAPPASPSR